MMLLRHSRAVYNHAGCSTCAVQDITFSTVSVDLRIESWISHTARLCDINQPADTISSVRRLLPVAHLPRWQGKRSHDHLT